MRGTSELLHYCSTFCTLSNTQRDNTNKGVAGTSLRRRILHKASTVALHLTEQRIRIRQGDKRRGATQRYMLRGAKTKR